MKLEFYQKVIINFWQRRHFHASALLQRDFADSGVTQVSHILSEFINPVKDHMRYLVDNFKYQVEQAIEPNTRRESSLKCFNTHIQNFPTGNETGDFLSMKLGGSDLCFMRITIKSPDDITPRSICTTIPENMKKCPGELLFDYMAENLRDFVWNHFAFRTEHVPLVFSFSFPVVQYSIERGRIFGWGKGFKCNDVIGKSINNLLREAAFGQGLSIDIKGIINDVGGTLVLGRSKTRLCAGSIILGSGTNAAYLERVKNIPDFKGDFSAPFVAINTEWGGFGDKGELKIVSTRYDKDLNETSLEPGYHTFEKMTSGLYLGEIVRLMLVSLIQNKLLLAGEVQEKLLKKSSFKTEYLTAFSLEQTKSCKEIVEEKLKISSATSTDMLKIKLVCDTVAERSSLLVAAGVCALSDRMALPVVTFCAEGALVRKHPAFRTLSEKAMEYSGPHVKKIHILPIYGADLKGAALLASCL